MLVQFGNNWIQKIPRTAKLDSAEFGSPRNFSHPIISKLDKHVVLLHIQKKKCVVTPNFLCGFQLPLVRSALPA